MLTNNELQTLYDALGEAIEAAETQASEAHTRLVLGEAIAADYEAERQWSTRARAYVEMRHRLYVLLHPAVNPRRLHPGEVARLAETQIERP